MRVPAFSLALLVFTSSSLWAQMNVITPSGTTAAPTVNGGASQLDNQLTGEHEQQGRQATEDEDRRIQAEKLEQRKADQRHQAARLEQERIERKH